MHLHWHLSPCFIGNFVLIRGLCQGLPVGVFPSFYQRVLPGACDLSVWWTSARTGTGETFSPQKRWPRPLFQQWSNHVQLNSVTLKHNQLNIQFHQISCGKAKPLLQDNGRRPSHWLKCHPSGQWQNVVHPDYDHRDVRDFTFSSERVQVLRRPQTVINCIWIVLCENWLLWMSKKPHQGSFSNKRGTSQGTLHHLRG